MNAKKSYLIDAITKQYLNLGVSKKRKLLNEKCISKKQEIVDRYGDEIKSNINELYDNIYSTVVEEVKDIVDYTLNYCFDIKNLFNKK